MVSEEEIYNQQTLLAEHRRTLNIYLRQRAIHGKGNEPPVVARGIEDARAEIARLKSVLRGWEVVVDDLPGDVEHTENETVFLQRQQHLEAALRLSRVRCIERWQDIGLSRELAIAFADEDATAKVAPYLDALEQSPMRVLVGDVGSGKSLIAERVFQAAVLRALATPHAPIPIYIHAPSLDGTLQRAVEEAAQHIGVVARQGAMIVVDTADEAGLTAAQALVSEARRLVNTYDSTRVLITSRPLPKLAHEKEERAVELLSEADALQLVGRVLEQELPPHYTYRWPEQLQEAIKRPIFALLLGLSLQEDVAYIPQVTGELLTSLVERLLRNANVELLATDPLLQRLANLCTERSGSVIATDVGTRADVQHLVRSRLVREHKGTISFSLAILTDWFAAQSLANGTPSPEELVRDKRRLESWRYPLTMFVGMFSHDVVTSVLSLVAEHHPVVAAQIVQNGIRRPNIGSSAALPSAEECGQRIREVMQAWVRGLGPLAQLIAPVQADGQLRTLGVDAYEGHIRTAWYHGLEALPPIYLFPPSFHLEDHPPGDWPIMYNDPVGSMSAWAWDWTLDKLTHNLSNTIQQKLLPIDQGSLLAERLWSICKELAKRPSERHQPIPLTKVEALLQQVSPNFVFMQVGKHKFPSQWLRAQVERLHQEGLTDVHPPWPEPDRMLVGAHWVWDSYSDDQLLARVQAVYTATLNTYQNIMEQWFPRLAPFMTTAVTLPARLVGRFEPARPERGWSGPGLTWYLEPLPRGTHNIVDIRLEGEQTNVEAFEHDWPKRTEQFARMRPEASEWIKLSFHNGVADVFGDTPVTDHVYKWLQQDLRQIGWL